RRSNTARCNKADLTRNTRGAFAFQILNFQRMFDENATLLQYNMLRSAFDPVYGKRTVNYSLALVSYYIEDGDYWKVDNVTLGYTLGQLRVWSNAITNEGVYGSGRYVYTTTVYQAPDAPG